MCCKWLSCQCRSHASMARVNTVRCGLLDESVIFTSSESCISFYSFICESVIHSILVFCLFTNPQPKAACLAPLCTEQPADDISHPIITQQLRRSVCHPLCIQREIDKPAWLMLNRTLQREQLEMKDIQQHVQNSPKNKLESIRQTATQASPVSLLLRPRAARMRDG